MFRDIRRVRARAQGRRHFYSFFRPPFSLPRSFLFRTTPPPVGLWLWRIERGGGEGEPGAGRCGDGRKEGGRGKRDRSYCGRMNFFGGPNEEASSAWAWEREGNWAAPFIAEGGGDPLLIWRTLQGPPPLPPPEEGEGVGSRHRLDAWWKYSFFRSMIRGV